MLIQEKMRRDWDRRARVDPLYWVAATQEADEASYLASAERDAQSLLSGLEDRLNFGGEALDLGCGIGRLTASLAEHFERVLGLDISPEMIREARQRHGQLENLEFCTGSGCDLAELKSEHFELVFSYSVLPHLPRDVVAAYFLEVGRVLRMGGWFRLQFWIGPEPIDAAPNDSLNIRVYTKEEVEEMARRAGLALREIQEIDYLDPVLQLSPLLLNFEKIAAGEPLEELSEEREESISDEEQGLEYGLLLYLAVKRAEQGEREIAEAVLERGIELAPDRPEAYLQWAGHRLEQGDEAGALLLLRTLTELAPGLPIAWLYLAQTAEGMGRKQEAREALKILEALEFESEEIQAEMLDLKARLRRKRRRR